MQAEYERVHRLLEKQFVKAVRGRDLASALFAEVHRDIPSGLPYPDGTHRIKKVSREYSCSLNELSRAVQRMADFKIWGIVPEDLKSESDPPE